jgi:bacteriorhodopsin
MDKFTQAAYRFLWFGICIFAIFAILYGILKPPQKGVTSPKFEVMDKYKSCEVIRWTDPSSRWHYFLDCNQSNHEEET